MTTVEPVEPPFENLDHLLDFGNLRGLTIESDAVLDGVGSFGTMIDIIPVLVYPDCVLDTYRTYRPA